MTRWLPAAVPLVVLSIGTWVLAGPPTRLAFRLYDDAYYYYGVARNLAFSGSSTFDGIHATNGYHPLWTWVLVPFLRLVPDPDGGVRAAGAVWFILAAASALAVAWAVRPRTGTAGAVVAAAVFGLHPFLGLALERPNGLETPLYALTIALAVGLFERYGPKGSLGSAVALGVAAGFVALSRLDGAFLAVSLAALNLLGRPDARGVGRSALIGCVSAAMIAPFLVWGALKFGSPMPVSGRIVSLGAAKERQALGGIAGPDYWKRRVAYAVRDIPAAVTRASVERFPGRGLLPPDAVTGALAVALWGVTVGIGLARRRSEGAIRTDALAAVSLFAILHYAAYAFWLWTGGEERYRLYYFLPQWMAFAMGLGAVAGGWNRRVLRCGFATMIFLAMAVHLILAVRDREAYQDVSDEPMTEGFIYGWVRETLPEDAILGARDAGKLGWFAGRPVVNLDGLINDQRLVAAIRDGREEEYVFESPIDYLFYSPWMVEGFDPEDPGSRPDRPVARMLAQLDRRPDCRVRRLPGDPAYWAVFKITRSDR